MKLSPLVGTPALALRAASLLVAAGSLPAQAASFYGYGAGLEDLGEVVAVADFDGNGAADVLVHGFRVHHQVAPDRFRARRRYGPFWSAAHPSRAPFRGF